MLGRALLLVALGATAARADAISLSGGSARAIGRAGTGLVSDDGAGALQLDPASMARRDTLRVQVGVGFADDALTFTADDPRAPDSRDQAGSSALPQLAVVGGVGDWVIGGSLHTVAAGERTLRDPREVSDPMQLGAVFEYRYAGIASELRRDALTLGVARRVGDALAIGLAVNVSRLRVMETRRLWAGFESAIGSAGVGAPIRDLQVRLEGDAYVPGATLGVLVAPVDTPLELAASVSWVKRASLEGTLTGEGVTGGPVLMGGGAPATLDVRQPITVRAGVRYVGDRISAELGGDLWLADDGARTTAWTIGGNARVIDPTSVSVALASVPSRWSLRTHGAVRGAVDAEVVAGLLWITGGYAYTVGGTAKDRLSPTFGDLGGHTVALGVEGTAGSITYTAGWSRTFARGRESRSAWQFDNPFNAGDGAVPRGTYDGSHDQVGVMIDVQL